MEGVANSSIGQVQSIQGAIKRHKELVSMMEDAFALVSGISETLLEISRSEVYKMIPGHMLRDFYF